MPTTLPPVEITGQTPVAYPFGLFSLPAATPPDGERWAAGVWWQSNAYQAVGVTYTPCTVDAPNPIDALDPAVVCGIQNAASFTVYAYSDLSVGGRPLNDKFAQARDVLANGEQFAVEQALWQLLLDATPSAGTAADVATAVAMLEHQMAALYTGTPTMHLPRYLAALSSGHATTRVDGARLRTHLGSSVVAGGGYGAVDDDPMSVIATGNVVILRGDINDLGQSVDQAINNVSAVVERTYLVGWDTAALRIEI